MKLTLFTGPECAPCRATKPRVETYAQQHSLPLTVRRAEDPVNEDSFVRYSVTGVPVLVIQKGEHEHAGEDEIIRGMPSILTRLRTPPA